VPGVRAGDDNGVKQPKLRYAGGVETRRHYHCSRRARAVAIACVVVVPVLYLLSGWFLLHYRLPGQMYRSVWIGSGAAGYFSSGPVPDDPFPGVQLHAQPFGLQGDFDCRERSSGWYVEYALWPLLPVVGLFFAWAWRWRTLPVGACAGCGYPLGGGEACPECGRSAQRAVA
jgi:hypothetical protein